MNQIVTPPTAQPERVRFTISVTPEVHAAFQRYSAISGMSVGRAVGDWLQDTLPAIDYASSMILKARQAPAEAMQQLQGVSAALAEETSLVLSAMRRQAETQPTDAAPAAAAAAPAPAPRLVIRGVNSPSTKKNNRGRKP